MATGSTPGSSQLSTLSGKYVLVLPYEHVPSLGLQRFAA
jgi:hypothetical protein